MDFCFKKNGTDIFSIPLEKYYLKPTRGEEGKKKTPKTKKKTSYGTQ